MSLLNDVLSLKTPKKCLQITQCWIVMYSSSSDVWIAVFTCVCIITSKVNAMLDCHSTLLLYNSKEEQDVGTPVAPGRMVFPPRIIKRISLTHVRCLSFAHLFPLLFLHCVSKRWSVPSALFFLCRFQQMAKPNTQNLQSLLGEASTLWFPPPPPNEGEMGIWPPAVLREVELRRHTEKGVWWGLGRWAPTRWGNG